MSWLDAILGRIHNAGIALDLGKGINFMPGLIGSLNAATKMVDLSVSVAAANVAPAAATGFSVPFMITKDFDAVFPIVADDVTVLAAAPYALRIIGAWMIVDGTDTGATVTLRTAAGGGGSVLSSVFDCATNGTKYNNDTVARDVAAGGSIFARRPNSLAAGRIVILAERT